MSIQHLIGQKLGQYELRELLGVGGMGAVYRGYQASLKRAVAVKILSPSMAAQADYLERFNREAETAARLEHRHIVPIYDYGAEHGISYVVMRLLTGGTLADRIAAHHKQGLPLPSLGEVAEILIQLASALDYAHSQHVIHRDIKSSNVMFDNQGSAYLVDFGIAKLLHEAAALTGSGVSMGTPAYMAPEQWRAQEITPATDQYAMGVLAYAMMTGHEPFDATTPYGLMHKHLHEKPTPIHVVRPETPAEATLVIERALSKELEKRFPTVTAFALAFEGAIEGAQGGNTNFFTIPLPRTSILPDKRMGKSTFTPSAWSVGLRKLFKRSRLVWSVTLLALAIVALLLVLLIDRGSNQSQSNNERESSSAAALNPPGGPEQTGQVLNATKTARAMPSSTIGQGQALLLTATAISQAETNVAPGSVMTTSTVTLTPMPTASRTPSPTPSLTATRTPRPTNTATFTNTPTATPAVSRTPSPTPSLTATRTPRPTNTATFTNTPTTTPSLTPKPATTPAPNATAAEVASLVLHDSETLHVRFKLPIGWEEGMVPGEDSGIVEALLFDPGTLSESGTVQGPTIYLARLDSSVYSKTKEAAPESPADLLVALYNPDRDVMQPRIANGYPAVRVPPEQYEDKDSIVYAVKLDQTDWIILTLSVSPEDDVEAVDRSIAKPLLDSLEVLGVIEFDEGAVESLPTKTVTPPAATAVAAVLSTTSLQPISSNNADTLSHIGTLSLDFAETFAWSPDSQKLAIVADNTLWLYDEQGERLPVRIQLGFTFAMAWSPDSTQIATLGGGGPVQIWDVASGTLVKEFKESMGIADVLAWSPDGERIVAGNWDGLFAIWDPEHGTQQTLITEHYWLYSGGLSVGASFTSDSSLLATASSGDNTVRLWHTNDWSSAGSVQHYPPSTNLDDISERRSLAHVSWSPDGTLLLTWSEDGVAKLWDAASKQQLAELASQGTPPVFSPDGSLLVAQDAKGLTVLDVRTLNPVETLSVSEPAPAHISRYGHIAFRPDGKMLSYANPGATIEFWGTTTSAEQTPPPAESTFKYDLSPISEDNASLLIEMAVIEHGPERGSLNAIAWSPDGKALAAGGSQGVWLYDTTDPAAEPRQLMDSGAFDVAWSPDGSLIAVGGDYGLLELYDAQSGEKLDLLTVDLRQAIWALAFSPDSTMLAAGGDDQSVSLWFPQKQKTPIKLNPQNYGLGLGLRSLVFSPDNSVLITGQRSGEIILWDTSTGDYIVDITRDQYLNNVYLAISPDGTFLASTDENKGLMLWDMRTRSFLARTNLEATDPVTAPVFSPDGTLLALGDDHDRVEIRSARSRELLMDLEGHLGYAADLAFNPAGTLLVTAGRDGTLRFWGVLAREPDDTATASPTVTESACTVSVSRNVNLRDGPGTTYTVSGTIIAGQSRAVIGQTTGEDGFVWWQVLFGSWVRSDVVTAAGDCESVPETGP